MVCVKATKFYASLESLGQSRPQLLEASLLHGSHGGWNGFHIQFRFSAIARTLLNHFSSNISFSNTRRLIGLNFFALLLKPLLTVRCLD